MQEIRHRVKLISQRLGIPESKIYQKLPHLDTDELPLAKTINLPTNVSLNQYIDHTQLKPNANTFIIDQLCQEAIDHNFVAICVNLCNLPRVVSILQRAKRNDIKIAITCGFPFGQASFQMILSKFP
jgi:deoxyribose-phosphate aldolase